MNKFMLLQILLERKSLTADLASKGFDARVRLDVSLESELGTVFLFAVLNVTEEFHFDFLINYYRNNE